MLDDFKAISHKLPGRTVKVWCVADVHIGSKECDMDGFKQFIKRVEQDHDAYIVCCGDLINNGVKDSLTNVYEETMPPSLQIETAVEMLRPVRDKILGMVGGNHEARSRKAVDVDPGYTIACMLGIPHLYRQNMAFVRVRLENGNIHVAYSMMLMHGKTANKKRNFAYSLEGVDALITGHTHDGIVEKPARLCFTQVGKVAVKSITCVTATSWLKMGGYGLAAMYAPKTTSNPQYVQLEWVNTMRLPGRVTVVW